MDLEKLYTVEDVASYTNLTSRTIRNYLRDGMLKGRKVGGQWRFTMQNIQALLENSQMKKEIISLNDQAVLDFIAGVNTDIRGEMQVSAVIDYYCPTAQDAESLHHQFIELLGAENSDANEAKYLYSFNEDEQKARYIFFGTPDTMFRFIEHTKRVWDNLQLNKQSFVGRAAHYLAGRPDYPASFFDFLYSDFGISKQAVIADIGSGIGMMSKHFLERGNTVYCIEPNIEMKTLSDQLLKSYRGYHSLHASAEDTRLETENVDYIFCGNVYGSFCKAQALLEFNRILKPNGKIIITHYYPDEVPASEEMNQLWSEFKSPSALAHDKRIGKEFIEARAIRKIFTHTYYQDFSRFLSGCLSSSVAPRMASERYDYFVNRLKEIFDRYSVEGKIECKFKLVCLIGRVEDLAIEEEGS